MATKSKTAKQSNKSVGKKVEVLSLPPVRTFGSTQPIVPAAEKAQITSIDILVGGKEIRLYHDGQFVKGLHPNQAQFVFNSVIGGTGTARGARQLGFAQWCADAANQFKAMGFSKAPEAYDVVINYDKRGGTMIFKLSELLSMCTIKVTLSLDCN